MIKSFGGQKGGFKRTNLNLPCLRTWFCYRFGPKMVVEVISEHAPKPIDFAQIHYLPLYLLWWYSVRGGPCRPVSPLSPLLPGSPSRPSRPGTPSRPSLPRGPWTVYILGVVIELSLVAFNWVDLSFLKRVLAVGGEKIKFILIHNKLCFMIHYFANLSFQKGLALPFPHAVFTCKAIV